MVLEKFTPGGEEFTPHVFRWPVGNQYSAGRGISKNLFVGPSATLIGWIPVYQHQEQLPKGRLSELWKEDSSIKLLLGTGNNPPPDVLTGPGDLIRYLNTREFRGVISIDQPTLEVDAEGQPVSLQFFTLARVGGTPLRGNSGRLNLSVLLFDGGVANTTGDVHHDRHEIAIRIWMRMKIGRIGQAVAKWTTGVWPPWAGLQIDYVFSLLPGPPSSRIVFRGTAVPSQSRYLSWKRQPEAYRVDYDMRKGAYEGFLAAGNCKEAPWEAEWSAVLPLKKTPAPAE